ncbi:MAG: type II secretion system protein [Candidatus Sungbacteria bacterium]|nr:type II secretion system protein [Candidatus Sungbacteria bacterium]
MSFPQTKKGFTLIELLVVISIISLLASIVLASLNSARVKARDVRRKADLRQLELAIQFYYDTAGTFPPSVTTGVDNMHSITEGGVNWPVAFRNELAPYLSPLPFDPIHPSRLYGAERMNGRAPDAKCNGQFVLWMYLENSSDPDWGKFSCGWAPLHYFRLLGAF